MPPIFVTRPTAVAAVVVVVMASCTSSQPREVGSFRGLGQEPGWLVEISSAGLRWVGDHGGVEFVTGPAILEETTQDRTVWTASVDDHQIRVSALEEVCHDTMSGHEFTHAVTVLVDGETYTGCGRWQEGPA